MAGKITHLETLSQVCKHLEHGSKEERNLARLLTSEETSTYANIGAIAPDIFYFYHILSPIKTKKATFWGDLSHHQKVTPLILNMLHRVLQTEETLYRDRMLAFLYGYVCHCVVDVVTHPYIFFISGDFYSDDPKISSKAQYMHMRVEYSLDSYLLHYRWGMTPIQYDFPKHVEKLRKSDGLKKMDPVIWKFWQDSLQKTFPEEFRARYIGSEEKIIPGDILNDAYVGFMEFQKALDSRRPFVRATLKWMDKLSFHKLRSSALMLPKKEHIDPRIMNEEKKIWHYPADPSIERNDSFIELINKSAEKTREVFQMVTEYLENKVTKDEILEKYDGYNLDTGLRYQDVKSMKEFAPL